MKNKCVLLIGIVFLAFAAVGFGVKGLPASYSLWWFTVDGGGARSRQGRYEEFGVIGQCDVGNLSGGNYTLQGGFLAGVPLTPTAARPYWTKY
jgi:hypothetical protein